MMKQKQKYVALIGMAIALIIVIIVLFEMNRPEQELFSVVIQYKDGQETISSWENGKGEIYFFLPGGVKLEDIQLVKQTQAEILMNGQVLGDEMTVDMFSPNTPYELTYDAFGKTEHKTMTFIQSANVATLYISTESGRTEYLHADKNNKEAGKISLYTSDGELYYHGEAESVSGRGDYTWKNSDKKPYNVVLSEEANLLDIGCGKKWVLLANSSDSTLMRNMIAYEFAEAIGMPFSPDSRWVDLYLNGEYRGVYQLTEAAEPGTDRVDISEEGIILAIEEERGLKENNDTYFVTEGGVPIEIRAPKKISEERYFELVQKVQNIENAILSEDCVDWNTGKNVNKLIDFESWIKRYLIEEVFANHDAFMRSAYFYCFDSTDRLYAGPVWDYDFSMGNENAWQLLQPQSFWANRVEWSSGMGAPWFYTLYQNPDFHQQMIEMYQAVFVPELHRLLNQTIHQYADELSEAVALNNIRWNETRELTACVQELCEYMEQRIAFFNTLWLQEQDYCIVRAVQQWGGYYAYYVVFTGDVLPTLPEFEDTESARFVGWYNEKTGEQLNIDQPITEDMQIYAKWVEKPSTRIKQVVKILPLGVIAVIGVGLAWVALKRMRKSR